MLLNYTTGYVFLLLHAWLYHQNDHTLASSREVNLIFQPVNQSEQVSTDHRGNDFPIVVPPLVYMMDEKPLIYILEKVFGGEPHIFPLAQTDLKPS